MTKKQKANELRMAELQVENWNLKYPVGTPVDLLRDSGTVQATRTRYESYVCEAGYAVCLFENVSGYYLLDRATPRTEETCSDTKQ